MSDPVTRAVEEQLRRILPSGVAVSAALISDEPPALLPSEQHFTDRMHPVRRREFTAGRGCARLALGALGLPPTALPAGADRAPVWPAGIAGSIAHTRELAVAAAVPLSLLSGLGIDLEPAHPLESELWPRVCRQEELQWADAQRNPGLAVALLFSAKESIFKCLWPRARIFLEFSDLCVRPDTRTGTFVVRCCGPALPESLAAEARGGMAQVAGHWLTAAWLPRGATAACPASTSERWPGGGPEQCP